VGSSMRNRQDHFPSPNWRLECFRAKRLLNTGLCWHHAGKDQLDFRSLAGFAIEIEPATQAIRDDAVEPAVITVACDDGCRQR
jgi:hypothetical protein